MSYEYIYFKLEKIVAEFILNKSQSIFSNHEYDYLSN